MVTLAEVLAAVREADARGVGEVEGLADVLAAAGLDPGGFVLVDASVWLWLVDVAHGGDD